MVSGNPQDVCSGACRAACPGLFLQKVQQNIRIFLSRRLILASREVAKLAKKVRRRPWSPEYPDVFSRHGDVQRRTFVLSFLDHDRPMIARLGLFHNPMAFFGHRSWHIFDCRAVIEQNAQPLPYGQIFQHELGFHKIHRA
jgi:hypothetical protein